MKIAYVANDGTVFDTEEACVCYEQGARVMLIANVANVKRKRFVDSRGIHYPIRHITVAASYGKGKTEFFHLEFDEHYGMRMNGCGIKKGAVVFVDGRAKQCAYEKDGKAQCFICMKNPSISFISKLNRNNKKGE